jgi:recombination protein RecR
MFSPLTKQLIEAFCALSGIGPKSAQRMAFQLLAPSGQNKGLTLAKSLQIALEQVKNCQNCRTYTENTLCQICANHKRNHQLLCIVEGPADIIAVEQTACYSGLYFVLHGHLSPLDGIGPNEIGIPILFKRLEIEPIQEVIIATNPTMEGKATAHYIASFMNHRKIKCTRIAHGVPMGGELEYLDGGTLAHALISRRLMDLTEPS